MSPLEGTLDGISPGEEVRVFFYLKNNYHTFATRVLEVAPDRVVVQQPPGVYKNLQRKFERVKLQGSIEVSFSLHGTKVELNFPKSDRFNPVEPPEADATFDPRRIQEVVKAFRTRMRDHGDGQQDRHAARPRAAPVGGEDDRARWESRCGSRRPGRTSPRAILSPTSGS